MDGRTAAANRVTWVGSLVNLMLTVFKLVAGLIGHSGAMIADAVHSLSDFATDIVVLVSLKIANKPADENHDYGHGKFETLATAIIGISLLLVGVGIFWSGATKMWAVIEGESLEAPGWVAFVAAVVSIMVKEVLYQYTAQVGRRISSQAVIANAWHHRSDALSSIGAMLGIGGAILLGESWHILDPLAAIVVSFFILKVSLAISLGSIEELTEKSLDEAVKTEIMTLVANVHGVVDPHHLRTRRLGSNVAVDLHIRVDARMSVADAHTIATNVEDRIRARFGISTFVSVHVEPLPEVKHQDPPS